MYYKATKFDENRYGAIFGKIKIVNFFSYELLLILGVGEN